ncbi:MAG: response regulator [Desulfobacterales bacterium]|nr:response regulator [Desulfobacterales bacterium]MDD3951327.1 response regulator [Desulfobacterales bacterium]
MSDRILVIDDEASVRKAIMLALEDEPVQVDAVENGEAGIEMAGRHKYRMIFLDLKMPGLNGVETLRSLRRIDADLPVYIITAFYGEFLEQLSAAEEEGLNFELLRKPIGGDQIRMIISGVSQGPFSY